MKVLLAPTRLPTHRFTGAAILLLLVASAVSVFVSPLTMPQGYSWISNVISESAAQGLTGAWVARLGFLLFGFAVLWLTISLRSCWPHGAYWCHFAFGLFMISTAAFSHRPWLATIPFDPFEDLLHSITATGMGIAFSFGVLVRLLQRNKSQNFKRCFDVVAIAAAVALPLAGSIWPHIAGLTQRVMFLVAYAWYGNEALISREPANSTPRNTA
ncbi:MAG: DUF998 domain-containing protein [Gammaproteobacteria bacterium]|nr:DUF998 domain-containing protein [Gammaproteobacteria bacterium]MDH3466817.1 DUF998 domain-containing protein [Gammaproteobacteria bacterium]